jgi:hypothetical protein
MKAAVVALATVLAMSREAGAASLDSAFADSVFRGIAVGQTIAISAAEQMGFEVAEALSAEKSDTKHDVLRLERPAGQRVYFVEVSVKNRTVQAEGWVMEVTPDSIEIRSSQELVHLVGRLGFPDDVIAEEGVHALAWVDRKRQLRFELLQQAPEASEPWELSAVLRRF